MAWDASLTTQQRDHPPLLQVFTHLPGVTTGRRGRPTVLASSLLACAGVLAATALACTGALAASAATRAAPTPAPCRGASLRPSAANTRAVDAATLCLINRVRRAHGVRALHANRSLHRVATSQASSMVLTDYYADDRPTGQTPMSLVAVTRYKPATARVAVGQNIAWGTGSDTTPARIVAALLASPPHREVMLSGEYRDAGVSAKPAVPAILHATGRGATYVIEFGARL
jgi:uncharacterized protein YkwD